MHHSTIYLLAFLWLPVFPFLDTRGNTDYVCLRGLKSYLQQVSYNFETQISKFEAQILKSSSPFRVFFVWVFPLHTSVYLEKFTLTGEWGLKTKRGGFKASWRMFVRKIPRLTRSSLLKHGRKNPPPFFFIPSA